jgi:hypothetical protein
MSVDRYDGDLTAVEDSEGELSTSIAVGCEVISVIY